MPIPLLIPLIGLGLGVAGGGSTILGGISAHKAANQQADYLGDVAEAQKAALRRAAKAEEHNRSKRADSMFDQQIRRRSKLESMYAKSGVLMSGTPVTYMAAQAVYDERNLQEANAASFYQQRVLRRQAENVSIATNNQQGAIRAQGDAARTQAIMSGVMDIGKSVASFGMSGGLSALGIDGGAGGLLGSITGGGGPAESATAAPELLKAPYEGMATFPNGVEETDLLFRNLMT